MSQKELIVGLHFYQPPRRVEHPEISHISTDPQNKDWTEIVASECYQPLAQKNITQKASFDLFGSLQSQLKTRCNESLSKLLENYAENGVGDCLIHPILPDLSREDKRLIIKAGYDFFMEQTNTHPQVFWPPETALDLDTLIILSQTGYKAFVCAPEQILQNDGTPSDNKPTQIQLPNGGEIIALPFDRSLSQELAFDPKYNADSFYQQKIKPKLSVHDSILAYTDAETFGHHFKNSDEFLRYLLFQTLPNNKIEVQSINNFLSKNITARGRLIERTAWSCPHGDLVRWHGNCFCSDQDSSWKTPYYHAMHTHNNEVTKIIKAHLPEHSSQFSNAISQFLAGNKPQTMSENLLFAKISSLVALTSCATFFSNINVSGKINLIFAYQSVLYIRDSGLTKEARDIEKSLFYLLDNVWLSSENKTAKSLLQDMLAR